MMPEVEKTKGWFAAHRLTMLYLVALATIVSVIYSTFTPEGLEKGAFLYAVTLFPMFLSYATACIGKYMASNRPLFNQNVAMLATCAVIIPVAFLINHDVTVFQDMVAEGLSVAIASGLGGLVGAYLED